MSSSPTSEAVVDTTFVCDCMNDWRSACVGESFYKEKGGRQYCLLHYPGDEKNDEFKEMLDKRIKNNNFNFRGAWFPGGKFFESVRFNQQADFSGATFSSNADFTKIEFAAGASFHRTSFRGTVSFRQAIFGEETDFNGAIFSGHADFSFSHFWGDSRFQFTTFKSIAYFDHAEFKALALFSSTKFRDEADFSYATFHKAADFISANFDGQVDFIYTNFKDYVRFFGEKEKQTFGRRSSINLEHAPIEKPALVLFHSLTLRPHWFVNIDARKFDFINVEWDWRSINEEIEDLELKSIASPHRMLAIACRYLAVNAEENHRYEEASKFRYMAMDVRRQESLRRYFFGPLRIILKIIANRTNEPSQHERGAFGRAITGSKQFIIRYLKNFNLLYWLYWAASGYGERVFQAFLVLIGIWLIFALLYTQVGFARWEPRLASESDLAAAKRDEVGAPLRLSRSLTYSLGVMTLQKPEPRPATTMAQTVVILETILGPVQAALLALAIRRKFMR